jgi:hypothetical protein
MSIRVNIAPTAESQGNERGQPMKNAKTTRGFWDWILGGGTTSTGSNGYTPKKSVI